MTIRTTSKTIQQAMYLFFVLMALLLAVSGCNWGFAPEDGIPSEPSIYVSENELNSTSRTVTLSITHWGTATVDSMMISNSEDFSGAVWEVFSENKEWQLSNGIGLKTVYIKFLSTLGIESEVAYISKVITDNVSPVDAMIVINDGDVKTSSEIVSLQLSSLDNYGITEMLVYPEGGLAGAEWEPFNETKDIRLTSGFGEKIIFALFMDESGNMSELAFDDIVLVKGIPEITTLLISPEISSFDAIGDIQSVDVLVQGADALVSSRLTLRYDPNIINAIDITTAGTGYLFTDSGASVIVSDKRIDNNTGTVVVGLIGQKTEFTGASGEGVLFSMTFSAVATGDTSIEFYTNVSDECIVNVYDEKNASFKRSQFEYNSALIEVR